MNEGPSSVVSLVFIDQYISSQVINAQSTDKLLIYSQYLCSIVDTMA